MAKKDRTGNRKIREQRKQFKVPELGYYLIVTDTEATERCFFTGLHQALPEDVRNKLLIKVVETKTRAMIDKCLELTAYDAQYRIPWIVFDRDQVQGFDEIIAEAVSKGIQVGWSNPCFEIWMYAYFGSMPAIQDSWACCSDFGRVYESSPNLCVNSSFSYVVLPTLLLSSRDLTEWSLVYHNTLSYQRFYDLHSIHYDHLEGLHQLI